MRKKLLFFFTVAAGMLFGQTADEIKKITANYDTAALQSLSEQYHAQFLADKEYAEKKAAELNLPLVIEKDGSYKELQKILPDGTPIYYTTFNLDAARSTRTNHLQAGGSLGLNLMGQNMTAHIWDAKVARITHQEYDGPGGNNRYSKGDSSTGTHYHSAHVAGTIMASGVQAQAKGMAPYAKAVGYDWNNDLGEASTAAANGMLISSHSYGISPVDQYGNPIPAYYFGGYTTDSHDWDNLLFNAPNYLMVVAAGNDGTTNYNGTPLDGYSNYDKLTGHATSKNNLVVANAQDANVDSAGNLISVYINSSSSQGPTDDYRIKPDITGNGTYVYSTYDTSDTAYNSITGTSMATPNVSGTLLLLQQHYNDLNSNYMRAATLKGLVLHTADDVGPTGPDAVWGWGLMNAKRAVETISHKDSHSLIEETSINTGQTLTYTVNSDGINPLIASISWTDRPGTATTALNSHTPVLVNDLDIRVTKGGTTYYPWKLTGVTTNTKGINNVDPFERVDIPGASGTYTITITYKGTLTGGSQNFSLIVTGINTPACQRAISSVSFDPVCGSGSASIDVTGNAGTTQLRLYTASLGGVPIGTINGNSGTFNTPNVTQTTTYYVAAADAGCESARYPVIINISDPPSAVNVVKTDHSTPGNCDLDYSELTASGAKSNNLLIDLDDINSSGWAYVRSADNRLGANLANSNNAGGTPYELRIYSALTGNNQNSELQLFRTGDDEVFDISDFVTLNFQFKHRLLINNGNYTRNLYLIVSTDDVNYYTAWSMNATASINAQTVNVDLSAFAGSSQLYYRFGYYGNSNGLNSWYIDDIKISGDKQAPVIWTPKEGLFTNQSLTVPYNGENLLKVYAAPTDTKTYTAVASLLPNACAATKSVEVNPDLSDYLANTGNWSVASNWSNNTVPDITKCVRVPAGKTLTVNVNTAQAKRLKVDAGGKIFIGNNRALTVAGSIQNDATADDFVIESGGSLVQNDDSAVNSGQITAKRNFIFSSQRKQYNYIISPVVGQPIKQIYANPPYVIYHKEEYNFFYNAYNGDYIAGRGLAIKEPPVASVPASTIDAVMKGEPFNGILNYPLSYTTTQSGVDHGFNLVGNPYPSNLDLLQLYQDNSSKITGDFMFWDNRGNAIFEQMGSGYGGSSYAVFNAASGPNGTGTSAPSSSALSDKKKPDRYARPGTAFLIRALPGANGQTLNFKNQYRVAANSPGSPEYFGKGVSAEIPDRYWLTLTTPSEVDFMTAVVYFDGGDDAYTSDDSDAFNSSEELYTLTGDHQLLIQGRKTFDNLDKVNLGYRVFETGTHIISVYDKEGVFAEGQNIWLIDLLLDRVVNLTEKPYKFMTRPGEYNDRFVLVYRPTKTRSIDANVGNEILFAKKDNRIVVTSTIDKISEIEIFNLVGKSVYKNSEINSNEFKINSLNFNHQVIVVAVKTETGEFVTRKFINN